jgi:hypothetical protein
MFYVKSISIMPQNIDPNLREAHTVLYPFSLWQARDKI